MFKVFTFIRKYSFAIVVVWMVLYAFDLIDDLQSSYPLRPPSQVAWMLVSDFLRCLLVMAIWIAANFNPNQKKDA